MSNDKIYIGKFLDTSFQRHNERVSRRYYIKVPPKLVDHPEFPFKADDILAMRLEGKKLVISRVKMVEE
jgi:hypothetical protein